MTAKLRLPATTAMFQTSDLARDRTHVIEVARDEGALIRDKDGVALLLTRARPVLDALVSNELARDFIQLVGVVDLDGDADLRSPVQYGGFAWLSVLPAAAQREFIRAAIGPLAIALSGGSTEPFDEVVNDWRATAESWADPEIRERLLADENAPLHDVSL